MNNEHFQGRCMGIRVLVNYLIQNMLRFVFCCCIGHNVPSFRVVKGVMEHQRQLWKISSISRLFVKQKWISLSAISFERNCLWKKMFTQNKSAKLNEIPNIVNHKNGQNRMVAIALSLVQRLIVCVLVSNGSVFIQIKTTKVMDSHKEVYTNTQQPRILYLLM